MFARLIISEVDCAYRQVKKPKDYRNKGGEEKCYFSFKAFLKI
jgi:hypothetical protein